MLLVLAWKRTNSDMSESTALQDTNGIVAAVGSIRTVSFVRQGEYTSGFLDVSDPFSMRSF